MEHRVHWQKTSHIRHRHIPLQESNVPAILAAHERQNTCQVGARLWYRNTDASEQRATGTDDNLKDGKSKYNKNALHPEHNHERIEYERQTPQNLDHNEKLM